ncbi:methyltransferase domain-containing protein [Geobacter hydrogenophilus]|uniref:SAM-dependent methyltransferase n=1 Tax=Geobacter hydrogenophilus TaxID=40983 RepID=A0A9W6G1Q8_9BACT|nr:methyltransferase domain-containing protein [Geobacter hydrogenophilus]MBT0892774.1 methyltransferase domain-containing protein [Geobacter hydrogenophilus]GLI38753.1 SAM-dependent methyltransferase [Geobacter hydrogenophilus]
MNDELRRHYERWVYPRYPLLASVRPWDTYALNLDTLHARFNGALPSSHARRILLAGCGSFSPYPTSLANPGVPITALDLSAANLRRARLHCLLHGRFGIAFERGDIQDSAAASGEYGFIDSFGVIHHLPNPLEGLRALERRLAPGGILRLMVYSRGARREAESIRTALRLLKIRDVATVKRLIRRAPAGSRFRRYVDASGEAAFDAGIADAFLHPRTRAYRTDELMALVAETGLTPLMFAHDGALPSVPEEVARLRRLEREGEETPNFILYLGRQPIGECGLSADARLMLNPALRAAVSPLRLAQLVIPPRLGRPNSPLCFAEKRFLRRFISPTPVASLAPEERERARPFLDALFLVAFR